MFVLNDSLIIEESLSQNGTSVQELLNEIKSKE